MHMRQRSAGLLMYRTHGDALEVLLVHPGGPYWKNRDEGAWTIPKGEIEDEDPLKTARREFYEETGIRPEGPFLELTPVRQKAGKEVLAWAFEGDCDPAAIESNTFEMEWPPDSGRTREFPEVDRADFFDATNAAVKINPAQVALVEELQHRLDRPAG